MQKRAVSARQNYEKLKKHLRLQVLFFWRRHPDLNWGVEVLQTCALPLGYGAVGAEDEIRTRDIRHGKATLYH